MLGTSRQSRMPIVGFGLLLAADGLAATTVSLAIGASSWVGWIGGLILSAYFVGLTLGMLYTPRLVATFGPARAFHLCLGGAVVGALLLPMVPVIVVWISLRMLSGFALAGLLLLRAPSVETGAATASALPLVVGSQLLFALGQPLLMVYGPRHVETFMIAVMVLVLGVALLDANASAEGDGPYRTPSLPTPQTRARMPFGQLLRVAPLGALGALAAGGLVGELFTLGPLWASLQGLTVGEISLFMVLMLAGGIALQLPLRGMIERGDRRIFLAGAAAALSILATGFAFAASGTIEIAAPLALVVGALAFWLFPLARAHTYDCAFAADRPATGQSLLALFGLGAAAGSLLSSALIRPLGPVGFAASIAVFAAPLAAFAFFQVATRKAVGDQPQTPFVLVAHPSLVASTLDADPLEVPSPASSGFAGPGTIAMPDCDSVVPGEQASFGDHPVPSPRAPAGGAQVPEPPEPSTRVLPGSKRSQSTFGGSEG